MDNKSIKKQIKLLKQEVVKQPLLFAHLADCYLQLQKSQPAQKLIVNGIGKFPDYASGWMIKGKLHLLLNQDKEAYEAFRQALNIDPNIPSALEKCSELAQKLGNRTEMVDHLAELNRRDPLNSNARSMYEAALMRKIAIEKGVYVESEVDRVMPSLLRQTLIKFNALPEELAGNRRVIDIRSVDKPEIFVDSSQTSISTKPESKFQTTESRFNVPISDPPSSEEMQENDLESAPFVEESERPLVSQEQIDSVIDLTPPAIFSESQDSDVPQDFEPLPELDQIEVTNEIPELPEDNSVSDLLTDFKELEDVDLDRNKGILEEEQVVSESAEFETLNFDQLENVTSQFNERTSQSTDQAESAFDSMVDFTEIEAREADKSKDRISELFTNQTSSENIPVKVETKIAVTPKAESASEVKRVITPSTVVQPQVARPRKPFSWADALSDSNIKPPEPPAPVDDMSEQSESQEFTGKNITDAKPGPFSWDQFLANQTNIPEPVKEDTVASLSIDLDSRLLGSQVTPDESESDRESIANQHSADSIYERLESEAMARSTPPVNIVDIDLNKRAPVQKTPVSEKVEINLEQSDGLLDFDLLEVPHEETIVPKEQSTKPPVDTSIIERAKQQLKNATGNVSPQMPRQIEFSSEEEVQLDAKIDATTQSGRKQKILPYEDEEPHEAPTMNRRKPGERIATKTLAELYASQGEWMRAIEVYEELIRLTPENEAYRLRCEALKQKI